MTLYEFALDVVSLSQATQACTQHVFLVSLREICSYPWPLASPCMLDLLAKQVHVTSILYTSRCVQKGNL